MINVNNQSIHWKRLNTIRKLDQANPEKYCWAELVSIAFETDRESREERKNHVSSDSCKKCEKCWCGKFTNGELTKVVE